MHRTTFPTLALLTILCCGSPIPARAQFARATPTKKDPQSPGVVSLDLGPDVSGVCTEEPKAKEAAQAGCQPRKRTTARQTRLSAVRRLSFLKSRPGKDPEMNELVFLRLGPAGIHIATNEKHVWQLLEADVPKDTLLVGCSDVCVSKVPSKNETTFRVVCQQAAFVRNDGLAGQADVLQYDSDAAIQLTGARLFVNLYRDAPPGRILAKEITLDFNTRRMRLSGVRTAAARVAKEAPQAGNEPRQRASRTR